MKSQITIKKIQELLIKEVQTIYVDDDTSRRMWWASLEVIQKDFLAQNYKQGGIWVASPLPAFNDKKFLNQLHGWLWSCLLYTSPSPRDREKSRMPSSA